MAGFFKFLDPNRDGPGVPKDAPPKPRIKVFFEVYFRKFWNLVLLNMLYLVLNFPALILGFFISGYFMQKFLLQNVNAGDELLVLQQNLHIIFAVAIFLTCMSLVTIGPVQAGFTYVLRNYSREEHAFIWWDFKQAAKKNFKQSLIVSAIDLVLTMLLAIDINYYYNPGEKGIVSNILSTTVLMIIFLYIMMHMYIYPMMVTFNLNIKQLYKNALMLSMAKFLPNLLIISVCGLIWFFALFLYSFVFIVFFLFILFSLIGFITNFYVYPQLIKYVLDEPKPDNEGKEEKQHKEKSEKQHEKKGE